MIDDLHTRQLAAATYDGEVSAFNYCIDLMTQIMAEDPKNILKVMTEELDGLVSLRDQMMIARELVLEHGVRCVVP
jgi:hypothetical protein